MSLEKVPIIPLVDDRIVGVVYDVDPCLDRVVSH